MQPSLPGVWGHPLTPTCSTSREGIERGPRQDRDGRMAMRAYGIGTRGTAGHAVRQESPERAQPSLVGAWGNPQPLSAPLTAREAGGLPKRGRAHPEPESERPYESGNPGRGEEAKSPIRRESPERAQPSLVGAWGEPPNLYPLRFPSGKRADLRSGEGRTAISTEDIPNRSSRVCRGTLPGHLGGLEVSMAANVEAHRQVHSRQVTPFG